MSNTVYSEMVMTPVFRVSYCKLMVPEMKELQDGTKYEEYSCTAMFPKTEDLTPLMNAYNEVMTGLYGADQSKWPQFRNPTFRDGDTDPTYLAQPDKYAMFKGYWIVKLSRAEAPGLVYGDGATLITDPKQVYSGMWGRAQVCAKNYSGAGNIGVKFIIYNFQKFKDDENLGGFAAPDPTQAFGALPGAAAPPTNLQTGFSPMPPAGAPQQDQAPASTPQQNGTPAAPQQGVPTQPGMPGMPAAGTPGTPDPTQFG
jgi:hypothetical protein